MSEIEIERLEACRRVYARLPRDLRYWALLVDARITEAQGRS